MAAAIGHADVLHTAATANGEQSLRCNIRVVIAIDEIIIDINIYAVSRAGCMMRRCGAAHLESMQHQRWLLYQFACTLVWVAWQQVGTVPVVGSLKYVSRKSGLAAICAHNTTAQQAT